MVQVVFIGFGNVNSHLIHAFLKARNIHIKQIFSRNASNFSSAINTIPVTSLITEIMDADIYIIGIPDDSISEFSNQMLIKNKLVVHTSGSLAMKSLSNNNRKGVFYPLQTFSKDREVAFSEIPILIEAENASDFKLLEDLGRKITKKVVPATSEERLKIHCAAVFVNNFVNHLYQIGSDILKEENLSFDLLKPLITETAEKILTMEPMKAQTGPALRNDSGTIEKHLHLLKKSRHKQLYELFTKEIGADYGKKL